MNTGIDGRKRRPTASIDVEVDMPIPLDVRKIDSLEELSSWLGAFRERLRLAAAQDRAFTHATLQMLEARYRERRAELS